MLPRILRCGRRGHWFYREGGKCPTCEWFNMTPENREVLIQACVNKLNLFLLDGDPAVSEEDPHG